MRFLLGKDMAGKRDGVEAKKKREQKKKKKVEAEEEEGRVHVVSNTTPYKSFLMVLLHDGEQRAKGMRLSQRKGRRKRTSGKILWCDLFDDDGDGLMKRRGRLFFAFLLLFFFFKCFVAYGLCIVACVSCVLCGLCGGMMDARGP